MSSSEKSGEQSLLQDAWYAARYYLGSRTGLVVLATGALAAAAYFNWGWLVAVGLAPIILLVAPCGAMCAMGYCMRGQQKTSGPDQPVKPDDNGLSLPLASRQSPSTASSTTDTGKKSPRMAKTVARISLKENEHA